MPCPPGCYNSLPQHCTRVMICTYSCQCSVSNFLVSINLTHTHLFTCAMSFMFKIHLLGMDTNGHRVSFWDDGNVMELNGCNACSASQSAWNHWIVYIKRVIFMVYELYVNEAAILKNHLYFFSWKRTSFVFCCPFSYRKFVCFEVLGMEPRVLSMVGKCFAIELHP